jgi:hypothetical protein
VLGVHNLGSPVVCEIVDVLTGDACRTQEVSQVLQDLIGVDPKPVRDVLGGAGAAPEQTDQFLLTAPVTLGPVSGVVVGDHLRPIPEQGRAGL